MELLMYAIFVVAGILVGVFIGIFIDISRMKRAIEERSVGHLRIDRSEIDEPPKPFLELKGNTIDSISKKDFVVLKVINENYISRN